MFKQVAFLLAIAVWSPAAALAQVTLPQLQGVAVRSVVTQTGDPDVLNYELHLDNANGTLPVAVFAVDLQSDATRKALSVEGLDNTAGNVLPSSARHIQSFGPTGLARSTFPTAPQDWRVSVDFAAKARWDTFANELAVGSSEDGFVILSRGLPGIRPVRLEANLIDSYPDEGTFTPQQLFDAVAAAAQQVNTVAPLAPPTPFVAATFAAEIETLRSQARTEGWIQTDQAANDLAATLATLQSELSQGLTSQARVTAQSFIDQVASLSCQTLSCPGNPPLTSEAFALMHFNMEFLRVNIPAKAYITNDSYDFVEVVLLTTPATPSTVVKRICNENTPAIVGCDVTGIGVIPYGVAVNSDESRVFVTNRSDNTVSRIDTVTDTVADPEPVGTWPWGVAFNPSGTKAYVANALSRDLSVLNGQTGVETKKISLTGIGSPPPALFSKGVAVRPDGAFVYVANSANDSLSIVDTTAESQTSVIDLTTTSQPGDPDGDGPAGVAVSPDGALIYVANTNSDDVSVVSGSTHTLITTIEGVGDHPVGVSFDKEGKRAYVTLFRDHAVTVIDPSTGSIIGGPVPLDIDDWPVGVALRPDGEFVYVANSGDATFAELDVESFASVKLGLSGLSTPVAFGQFITTIGAQ